MQNLKDLDLKGMESTNHDLQLKIFKTLYVNLSINSSKILLI